MKNQLIFAITILMLSAVLLACKFTTGADDTTSNSGTSNRSTTVKSETENQTKSNKTGNGSSKSEKTETTSENEDDSTVSEDAPDPKSNTLQSSARPEGESKPVSDAIGGSKNKTAQTQGNWLYVYNSRKGYGFYVPPGSTGDWGRVQKVDTFAGATPNGVGIFVFAWKDKKASRETLLRDAGVILQSMGETVTASELTTAGGNYALAEATSVDNQGVKSRMKVLVGTDITDNYVMIVGCDEKDFKAKQETINAIWGSFEMWSGGGSRR